MNSRNGMMSTSGLEQLVCGLSRCNLVDFLRGDCEQNLYELRSGEGPEEPLLLLLREQDLSVESDDSRKEGCSTNEDENRLRSFVSLGVSQLIISLIEELDSSRYDISVSAKTGAISAARLARELRDDNIWAELFCLAKHFMRFSTPSEVGRLDVFVLSACLETKKVFALDDLLPFMSDLELGRVILKYALCSGRQDRIILKRAFMNALDLAVTTKQVAPAEAARIAASTSGAGIRVMEDLDGFATRQRASVNRLSYTLLRKYTSQAAERVGAESAFIAMADGESVRVIFQFGNVDRSATLVKERSDKILGAIRRQKQERCRVEIQSQICDVLLIPLVDEISSHVGCLALISNGENRFSLVDQLDAKSLSSFLLFHWRQYMECKSRNPAYDYMWHHAIHGWSQSSYFDLWCSVVDQSVQGSLDACCFTNLWVFDHEENACRVLGGSSYDREYRDRCKLDSSSVIGRVAKGELPTIVSQPPEKITGYSRMDKADLMGIQRLHACQVKFPNDVLGTLVMYGTASRSSAFDEISKSELELFGKHAGLLAQDLDSQLHLACFGALKHYLRSGLHENASSADRIELALSKIFDACEVRTFYQAANYRRHSGGRGLKDLLLSKAPLRIRAADVNNPASFVSSTSIVDLRELESGTATLERQSIDRSSRLLAASTNSSPALGMRTEANKFHGHTVAAELFRLPQKKPFSVFDGLLLQKLISLAPRACRDLDTGAERKFFNTRVFRPNSDARSRLAQPYAGVGGWSRELVNAYVLDLLNCLAGYSAVSAKVLFPFVDYRTSSKFDLYCSGEKRSSKYSSGDHPIRTFVEEPQAAECLRENRAFVCRSKDSDDSPTAMYLPLPLLVEGEHYRGVIKVGFSESIAINANIDCLGVMFDAAKQIIQSSAFPNQYGNSSSMPHGAEVDQQLRDSFLTWSGETTGRNVGPSEIAAQWADLFYLGVELTLLQRVDGLAFEFYADGQRRLIASGKIPEMSALVKEASERRKIGRLPEHFDWFPSQRVVQFRLPFASFPSDVWITASLHAKDAEITKSILSIYEHLAGVASRATIVTGHEVFDPDFCDVKNCDGGIQSYEVRLATQSDLLESLQQSGSRRGYIDRSGKRPTNC